MVTEFTLDFAYGLVFGITQFFAVLACSYMFRAFKLPADAG
jgi:hypothetical protein